MGAVCPLRRNHCSSRLKWPASLTVYECLRKGKCTLKSLLSSATTPESMQQVTDVQSSHCICPGRILDTGLRINTPLCCSNAYLMCAFSQTAHPSHKHILSGRFLRKYQNQELTRSSLGRGQRELSTRVHVESKQLLSR